jgi:hypothetical protein
MKKKFEFEGRPSGDGESFCWEVDRETLERLSPLDDMELSMVKHIREDLGEVCKTRHDYACVDYNYDDNDEMYNMSDKYRLYPDDIFKKPFPERFGKAVKITIEYEDDENE